MTKRISLAALGGSFLLAACGGGEPKTPTGIVIYDFGSEVSDYIAVASPVGALGPLPPAELAGAGNLNFDGKVALWSDAGGGIGTPQEAEYIGRASIEARIGDGELDLTFDTFVASDSSTPPGTVTSAATLAGGTVTFTGPVTGSIGTSTVAGDLSGTLLGTTFPDAASGVLDLTLSSGVVVFPYTGLFFTERDTVIGIN